MGLLHKLVFFILCTLRCFLGGQMVVENQSGAHDTQSCIKGIRQHLLNNGWMQKASPGGRSDIFSRVCNGGIAPCAYLVDAQNLERLRDSVDPNEGAVIKHILVVFKDTRELIEAKKMVVKGKKSYPSLNFLGIISSRNCNPVLYSRRLHEYLTGLQHHVIVRRNVGNDLASDSTSVIQTSISSQVNSPSVAIISSSPQGVLMSTTSKIASRATVSVSPTQELGVSKAPQSSSVVNHTPSLQKGSSSHFSTQTSSFSISARTTSPYTSVSSRPSAASSSESAIFKTVVEGTRMQTPSSHGMTYSSVSSSAAKSMVQSPVMSSQEVKATEMVTSTSVSGFSSSFNKVPSTSVTVELKPKETTQSPGPMTPLVTSQFLASSTLTVAASRSPGTTHSPSSLPYMHQTSSRSASTLSGSESVTPAMTRVVSLSESSSQTWLSSSKSLIMSPSTASSKSYSESVLLLQTTTLSLSKMASHSPSSFVSVSSHSPQSVLPFSRTSTPLPSPASPSASLRASLLASASPSAEMSASLPASKSASPSRSPSSSLSVPPAPSSSPSTSPSMSPAPSPSPSPSPSPTPSPTQPPTARYQVKLDGNCSFLSDDALKSQLKLKVKLLVIGTLKVNSDAVVIEDVSCGSVVVTFKVLTPPADAETSLRNAFTNNRTLQVGSQQLKVSEFKVLTISKTTAIATMTTTKKPSSSRIPQPSPTPTGKPGKKKDTAMILYIAIGCVAGFILLVIVVVAIRGCRQRASKGALTINDKADFELGHFQSIPRAKVKMYGQERESRTESFDSPYSGYTEGPTHTQLRLQDENNLSGSRDNLIHTNSRLRGIDNPALAFDEKDEK